MADSSYPMLSLRVRIGIKKTHKAMNMFSRDLHPSSVTDRMTRF